MATILLFRALPPPPRTRVVSPVDESFCDGGQVEDRGQDSTLHFVGCHRDILFYFQFNPLEFIFRS